MTTAQALAYAKPRLCRDDPRRLTLARQHGLLASAPEARRGNQLKIFPHGDEIGGHDASSSHGEREGLLGAGRLPLPSSAPASCGAKRSRFNDVRDLCSIEPPMQEQFGCHRLDLMPMLGNDAVRLPLRMRKQLPLPSRRNRSRNFLALPHVAIAVVVMGTADDAALRGQARDQADHRG